MKFLTLIFLVCVTSLLVKCSTGSKNQIDYDKALKLSKEGATLIGQAMGIEHSDSLKAQRLYREALNKYLLAHEADTSHKYFCLYLPDLYGKLHQFDSSTYWKNYLDTLREAKK